MIDEKFVAMLIGYLIVGVLVLACSLVIARCYGIPFIG